MELNWRRDVKRLPRECHFYHFGTSWLLPDSVQLRQDDEMTQLSPLDRWTLCLLHWWVHCFCDCRSTTSKMCLLVRFTWWHILWRLSRSARAKSWAMPSKLLLLLKLHWTRYAGCLHVYRKGHSWYFLCCIVNVISHEETEQNAFVLCSVRVACLV